MKRPDGDHHSSSVTTIEDLAFNNCKGLTELTLPSSVTNFGPAFFAYDCPATVYGVIGSEAEKMFADRFLPGMPGVPAYVSTQKVQVNGKPVEFQMYALNDMNGNPTNYVKLRDMAHVLNGISAQFSVGYSNYSGDRAYVHNSGGLTVDGSWKQIVAITLTDDDGGDYNYFKLRDLGTALGFTVGWSAERGVYIETR